MSIARKTGFLILAVLLLDQIVKIWVKTCFTYDESMTIMGMDWLRLHFVENNGMAFGKQLPGEYGKLLLSLFRLLAAGFILFYIRQLIKHGSGRWLITGFALILAGALGNLIDSAFYGLFFSASGYHTLASFWPAEGGYAGFLHGKVVDMFQLRIWRGQLPSWLPIWGGHHAEFFRPIFNLADLSITTGVILVLWRQPYLLVGKSRTNPLAAGQVVEVSQQAASNRGYPTGEQGSPIYRATDQPSESRQGNGSP